MGSLAQPGPQLGYRGVPPTEPTPGVEHHAPPFMRWFFSFLREELAPYPGRGLLVLRMVIAAVIAMLAVMIFHLPSATTAAFFTILLVRSSPINTARGAVSIILSWLAGSIYVVMGVILFVDYPLTHFLWVIGSLFLSFFFLKVLVDANPARSFVIIVMISLSIWDSSAPTITLVVSTLWNLGDVAIGLLAVIAVEFLFAAIQPKQELETALLDRLATVQMYLRQAATGRVSQKTESKLEQLATVGVSRLRVLVPNAGSSRGSAPREATTISLVGRLVQLAATAKYTGHSAVHDKERLMRIADALGRIATQLGGTHEKPFMANPAHGPSEGSLISELERTVELLRLGLSSTSSPQSRPAARKLTAKSSWLVADAFTNPEHLSFALRGCLASSLCYIIWNAVDWPGLNTSLITCFITALSSVGSERQKQLLRFAGAILGGVIFGIGSQVFVLPWLDSIVGFTVLFVFVTAISAWIATSSPRISYLGLQSALAFYLIQLQQPFPDTDLSIARNRVVGILLGLFMMWLAFDSLGSDSAIKVMRKAFIANLRLLAQLAKPLTTNSAHEPEDVHALCEKISGTFNTANAQADGVLFELGPNRRRDLAFRSELLAWQPRLRSLFLLEVSLLHYRTQPSTYRPLPPEIINAQQVFDRQVSALLESMAGSFSGQWHGGDGHSVVEAYLMLQQAISGTFHEQLTPRVQGMLAISSQIAQVLETLAHQMQGTLGRSGKNQGKG